MVENKKRPAGSGDKPKKAPRAPKAAKRTKEEEIPADSEEIKPAALARDADLPEEEFEEEFEEDHDCDDPDHHHNHSGSGGYEDSARPNPRMAVKPEEEYALLTYYDRGSKAFVGTYVEVPEVQVLGASADEAAEEAYYALLGHLDNLKKQNKGLPAPMLSKSYPPKIEVALSPGAFRRLDLLSRLERMPVDKLASEILGAGIEKRTDAPGGRAQGGDPGRRHSGGGGQFNAQGKSRHQGNHPNRNSGGGGGNRRRANYHETMDSRENFMEYVRNLEKGNFRKK